MKTIIIGEAFVKGLLNQFNNGQISFGKMTELLNEKALSEREQPVKDGVIDFLEKEIDRLKAIRKTSVDPQRQSLTRRIHVIESLILDSCRLSPCKEKWISEEEIKEKAIEFADSRERGGCTAHQCLWRGYEQGFKDAISLPSPPTGDNKKGEENEGLGR